MGSFKGYKKVLFAIGAIGLVSQFASPSFAGTAPQNEPQTQLSSYEKDFLSIENVQITTVEESLPNVSPCYLKLSNCPTTFPIPQVDSPISQIGTIVAIGQKIWAIVEAGRPTGHIVTNSVAALPKENPNWTQMTDWKGPLTKTYHLEATNKLGFQVVSMDYKILAYYGGKYKGTGAYLTNLTMVTDRLSVAWGYNVTATAELTDLVNTATEENPIPGCTMEMKWKFETVLQLQQGTHAVFVKGDGSIKDLN